MCILSYSDNTCGATLGVLLYEYLAFFFIFIHLILPWEGNLTCDLLLLRIFPINLFVFLFCLIHFLLGHATWPSKHLMKLLLNLIA